MIHLDAGNRIVAETITSQLSRHERRVPRPSALA